MGGHVRFALIALVILSLALASSSAVYAAAALAITTNTWNTIGLDSNKVTTGPNDFPVGARVCNTGDATATNVTSTFVFDNGSISTDPYTGDAYINLRPGSLAALPDVLSDPINLAPGACTDFYYEVEVTRTSSAYDQTRQYHITATADTLGVVSTTTPRQLYVEHLISQNRNGLTDVKLDGVSIPAGGSMDLVVGNTYTIELDGFTATQGYNQLESFIHFPNTIFQVLSVESTYSANSNPSTVPVPNPTQYANACVWDEDPNSPTYRNCIGNSLDKAGGDVVVVYQIKVLSGGGTSETLNSLLYDFSGSSYHYNSDYSTSARIANLIDPSQFPIAKSFNPASIYIDGISALTITLTNPTGGTVSGFNFTDPLPANVKVANPPNASTSGCGTPTFAPAANDTSLSFSDGTLAPNSNCTIRVNVTANGTGSPYTNTTGNLFIGTTDTGNNATAMLTAAGTPPGGTGCPGATSTMALWNFNGFVTDPPPFPAANTQSSGVATAAISVGGTAPGSLTAKADGATGNPVPSIRLYGWNNAGPINPATFPFVQFRIDTSNFTNVKLSFDAIATNPGPENIHIYYSTNGTTFTLLSSSATTTAWTSYGAFDFTGLTNPSGDTYFRIYGDGANNPNSGADLNLDNVSFTGDTTSAACTPPTIAKAFSPNPIAVGANSTLTFTLSNSNSIPLTGASFTDSLPTGVEVAAPPNASNTCTATWAPGAGETSLTFSGGTIPANGSCTAQVDVIATTAGPHVNVSGYLSTTQSGTNTNSLATDTLVALKPPTIDKQFAPNPIIANGISTLTFTITNVNQNDAISGVKFSDTFPTSPAAMVAASTPNPTYSGCGAGTFGTVNAGATSVSFTGGTIAAGGTCTATIDVTVPSNGTYNNTSGAVTYLINGVDVGTDTASDSLVVTDPTPAIGLTKQVSDSATGPWRTFVAVGVGDPVFYRFVIENTGDVPLISLSVSDPTLAGGPADPATCIWTEPLPVASPTVDPTEECIKGPIAAVSGLHPNTATAQGDYARLETTVFSLPSTATYATTGLTIIKSVQETSFSKKGDVLHYSYLVTNSGFAPLAGPVTIDDDKSTDETCPPVSTGGDGDNFLDPGEQIICTATYTVTDADVTAGFVTNVASATAGGVTSPTDTRTVRLASTAVNVTGFRAFARSGRIVLKWRTTTESQIAGFNVSRATKKAGFKQINTSFLQAKHAGNLAGDRYRFADKQVRAGHVYRYKIEVVYLDGHSESTIVQRVKIK